MNIHFNTMLKNEEHLLKEVLPIWLHYPINKFVFYNDDSTDNSIEIIFQILGKDRVHIIENNKKNFNESYNRGSMLEYSRSDNADYVFCIDADELLSANFLEDFNEVIKVYEHFNLNLYWYNVVENKLSKIRQDPLYIHNYRTFILPIKHTDNFDLNNWKYHVPRTPTVHLPMQYTKEYGVIHLQAINKKFYTIKQLWYKHYEFIKFQHSIEEINNKYDPVINNLNFCSIDTPDKIIKNIKFDSSIYEKMLQAKEYYKFIVDNYNDKLITFGKEYFFK